MVLHPQSYHTLLLFHSDSLDRIRGNRHTEAEPRQSTIPLAIVAVHMLAH